MIRVWRFEFSMIRVWDEDGLLAFGSVMTVVTLNSGEGIGDAESTT